MDIEKKATEAITAVQRELNSPFIPAGAKAAVGALGDVVAALAHEVAILKQRADAHALRITAVDGEHF